MASVYNVMETLVKERMDDVLKGTNGCKCQQCYDDIMAFTLNNLKPKYVASTKGEVYARVDELANAYHVEIVKEIVKASQIVSENPRHISE